MLFWSSCNQVATSGDETSIETEKQQPINVIYILADDMGYGDLGCYGQKSIQTPNIDRLAAEGARFTNHYSGSTVCAPSRASLLTGLHTGHTPIRGNKEYQPEGQEPLPDTIKTTADFFKENGYVTAATGKWGLGFVGSSGDPNNQGFDYFYGYNCQREAHRYYPDHLWENQSRVEIPKNVDGGMMTYAQDMINQKALDFIEANKDTAFYLYLPYVAPHAELVAPEDSLMIKYREIFKDNPGKAWKAKNQGADYGPDMVVGYYASQNEPRATYAAMIQRLDVYVGQIMSTLEKLGIADHTMVIFTSDNGPSSEGGADPNFFESNGGFRGLKRDLYDGGVRVPFIARLPEVIKPGTVSDVMTAFWDMNVTYADMLDVNYSSKTDGISMLPSLKGEIQENKHEFLYWEFPQKGGRQAIRTDKYKLVKLNVNIEGETTSELYDLENDPHELSNIYTENPDIVATLEAKMDEQHIRNLTFPLYAVEGENKDKQYKAE